MISIDDFSKVEIKVGKILTAEKVEKADKLLRLTVDFGLKPVLSDKTGSPDQSLEIGLGLKPLIDKTVRPITEGDLELKPIAAPVVAPSLVSSDLAQEQSPVIPVEERDIRQIVSGIALHFPDPQVLVGRLCPFVTNLEYRMIRGFESQGMILAASTSGGAFSLFSVDQSIPPGTKVK